MIAQRLLEVVACPQCHSRLTTADEGLKLKCQQCQLVYPVRDGVPQLVLEEAIDLRQGQHLQSLAMTQARFREKRARDTPRTFFLELGTCKIIGRPPGDPNKTSVMHLDTPLALDETTKNLILQYIHKQFKKPADTGTSPLQLGSFRRTSDLILDDPSVSRVHAIFFFDEAGIGVLDLVSKNGTFVNGQEVESRLLQKGDLVEIGDSKLLFEGV